MRRVKEHNYRIDESEGPKRKVGTSIEITRDRSCTDYRVPGSSKVRVGVGSRRPGVGPGIGGFVSP